MKTKSASAPLCRAALLLALVSFHSSFSIALAQLVTTFTNPTPAIGDGFGSPVAAMGTDLVLIGAPGNETAYLFNAPASIIERPTLTLTLTTTKTVLLS